MESMKWIPGLVYGPNGEILIKASGRELKIATLSPEELKCEICDGKEGIMIEDPLTGYTSAKICECVQRRWMAGFLPQIPIEYRDFRIETVTPRPDKHFEQPRIIEAIRALPDDSWILHGVHGTGKSLLGWLLVRWALEHGRMAIGLSLAELLMYLRRYERDRDAKELPCHLEQFLSGERRCTLFIDEFDQTREFTDWTCEVIEMLLNAIYRNRHQLIVTVNISLEELEQMLMVRSADKGSAMLRKIFQLHGMHREEFK